jgi:hypothetical protein
MTTFSQLIDEIALETRRMDLLSMYPSFLNQTIRELHSEPERNCSVVYDANLVEERIRLDGTNTWEITAVETFQRMQTVRYDDVFNSDGFVYPRHLLPGRILNGETNFYYRAGDCFVFSGAKSSVSVSFYRFPSRLAYAPIQNRKVAWNQETGQWVFDLLTYTEEQKKAILSRSTNWLIRQWPDTLLEGLRAKIYKRLGDNERATMAYSAYKQMAKHLYSSGVYSSEGV